MFIFILHFLSYGIIFTEIITKSRGIINVSLIQNEFFDLELKNMT